MKCRRGRVLGAVLGIALAMTQIPGIVSQAAWMPDHQIPAYQQKDIFSTDTVTIPGLAVNELVDSTETPLDREIKFVIFNSTKQVIEQEVTSQNGKLPDLNLVKNHNYIIWVEDTEYKMSNLYVWVRDGRLVDIKKNVDTGNYPEVTSLELTKREQPGVASREGQRVRSNMGVYTTQGGRLFNINFKFISNIETIEVSSGNNARLNVDLLEDVVYMVTVDDSKDDSNFTVEPFPIVIKDKSEYGAGKYTYDFSSCAKVDNIYLVNKSDGHKNDMVLTNTNYDDIYQGIYENVAGNTTITGMNFKDFLVLDRKLDKSTVKGMADKDYEVFDIKVVNPHRWEIAYIAAGNYEITEQLGNTKTVKNVYYVDDNQNLQQVPFTQKNNKVTFSMNTLSMYPVVVEYDSNEVEIVPEINEVNASASEIEAEGGGVTVTVKGIALPDKMYYTISYVKQGANGEEETVAVEAQEVEVQGSAVEKTMTVTLPNAEKYSEALQWIIKVSDTQNGDYYASQKISIKSASTEPENPDPNPGNGQDDNNDNHNGNGNGNSNNKNNTTNNKNGKTDVKKNNPQTGDTANIAMPIIGIGFAVLLLALAMILRKKSVENCR